MIEKNKKILFISHDKETSGANKSLLGILKNLKKIRGISLVVLVPGKGALTNELDKLNIKYIVQKYYWYYYGSRNGSWIYDKFKIILNIYCRFLLYVKLRKIKVDLIHTNSSVVNNIGVYLSKIKKVPHILHIREFGKEDHRLNYRISFEYIANYINKNVNEVIFISKDLSHKFLPYLTKPHINIIYNGIDIVEGNEIEKKWNKEILNLCILGTIHEGKNQLEAVKAVKIVIEKYKNIKLYIVGNGRKEYIKKINRYIKENNLEKNIFLIGQIKDPMQYLKNIDIGIVPSKREAFGRVTVEYMLNKIPVIVSNTGANPEIITANEDGLVYPLGNIEALSEAIKELLDIEKRKEIGEKGYKKAMNYFTAKKNAENIFNIYKKYL